MEEFTDSRMLFGNIEVTKIIRSNAHVYSKFLKRHMLQYYDQTDFEEFAFEESRRAVVYQHPLHRITDD